MAQNVNVTVAASGWTQLTDADVTAITFQVVSAPGASVLIAGTTGATEPGATVATIRYEVGQGERNVVLSDLFPGIAAARVWAKGAGAVVAVSHA